MVFDTEGQPLFLQGIAFDVTEQKEAEAILFRSRAQLEEEVQRRTVELGEANRALKAEAAEKMRADLTLRDREARLRSIVESVVDGILVIDQWGNVEAFNPSAERIFGYAAAEILGESICKLIPVSSPEAPGGNPVIGLESDLGRVIGIGRDMTGRRKDGSEFPLELAISETPTPDGVKFTGILRDVTDRKRDESALIEAKLAAEAASKLKGHRRV